MLGAGAGVSHSVSLEELVEEEESDGEPEYMPPKVIRESSPRLCLRATLVSSLMQAEQLHPPALAHDPPFEIPDLKDLGRAAKQAAFFGRWEEEDGEVMLAPIEMTDKEMEQGGFVEGGYVSEIKVTGKLVLNVVTSQQSDAMLMGTKE